MERHSFSKLYEDACRDVIENPDYITSPRGMKIYEKTNVLLTLLDPTNNLFKNDVRKFPKKYLAGELIWYFSGDNSLDYIQKYSKFWNNISNDDGTVNSAYGYLLFKNTNEWEWAKKSLIKDKDSRQAIIRFNKPFHSFEGNKDFVCTIYGIFHIRDNKLNLTIHMRSNDLYFGLTYDLPFFTLLQQHMLFDIKEHYPEIELGSYSHFVNSLHIYDKDIEKITNAIESGFQEDKLPQVNENMILDADIFNMKNNIDYIGMDELKRWINKNRKG